jgi:hypothetical protein
MMLVMMLTVSPAESFDCPVPQPVTDSVAIKETQARITQLSEALEADESGAVTEGTIYELRQRYPKTTFAEIVNYMVAAYCPIVAKNDSLNDAEKKSRVDSYAEQVEALAVKP